jgi:hypothetical protein
MGFSGMHTLTNPLDIVAPNNQVSIPFQIKTKDRIKFNRNYTQTGFCKNNIHKCYNQKQSRVRGFTNPFYLSAPQK